MGFTRRAVVNLKQIGREYCIVLLHELVMSSLSMFPILFKSTVISQYFNIHESMHGFYFLLLLLNATLPYLMLFLKVLLLKTFSANTQNVYSYHRKISMCGLSLTNFLTIFCPTPPSPTTPSLQAGD